MLILKNAAVSGKDEGYLVVMNLQEYEAIGAALGYLTGSSLIHEVAQDEHDPELADRLREMYSIWSPTLGDQL